MEPRKRVLLHYVDSRGVDVFREWIEHLEDLRGRAAILKRLDRVAEGLLGDHRYIGKGVWELRIHFGPGYRVYYAEDSHTIILLLLGGDKGSQARNIHYAQTFLEEYRRAF